jgi:hypothetical protein
MIKRIITTIYKQPYCQIAYRFGGGGGHHEIDYHAVVTKNEKSGINNYITGYYLNPNEVARRIARVIANF